MNVDNQLPEAEPKFNYIEEKVVPKRRKKIKKFLFSLFCTIIFAIVFGLVARYIFIISEDYFHKIFGTGKTQTNDFKFPSISPTEVLSPTVKPTPTPLPTPTPVVDVNIDEPPQIIEYYIPPTAEDYQKLNQDLMRIANDAIPAIATVSAIESGTDWFNETFELKNSTSGAIIRIDRMQVLILTAYSEIKDAAILRAEFCDGTTVNANIYNYDSDYDIAILSVSIKDISMETLENIKEASLDNSYMINVGMPVIAIGNPNGNQASVDFGIISRKVIYKSILDSRIDLYQTNLTYYENSGGFLLNVKGDIVGCITHTHLENQNESITTIMGIYRLQTTIEKLISKSPFVYLGVVVEDIPKDVLTEMGIEYGVFVSDLRAGSPAFYAGIQRGDIITLFGTHSVSSVNIFINSLNYYSPGISVDIKVRRSNKQVYKDIDLTAILSAKGR